MNGIVVGIEDSAAAQRALDRALAEGASTGWPVLALHTCPPLVPLSGVPGYASLDPSSRADLLQGARGDARALLAGALRRREAEVPVTARAEVVTGVPGRELVAAARLAGLLVVGGRGRGGVASAVLGSTTAYALHHAQCPVMIVPAGAAAGRFRRVVVGVDGSTSARTALLWGLSAARRGGCPLLVVHSWQSTTAHARVPMAAAPTLPDHRAAAREWLEQELAEALPDDSGVDVRTELVHSTPAWGCLRTAGDEDLLVVGSRGRGGFASLVLGSVATQCSQHTAGALVVVRAGQARLEQPHSAHVPAQEVLSAPPSRV